jgi:hypothetical protein
MLLTGYKRLPPEVIGQPGGIVGGSGPRAHCTDLSYQATDNANWYVSFDATGSGDQTAIADDIEIDGTSRGLCEIQIAMFKPSGGDPYNLTVKVYDACPSTGTLLVTQTVTDVPTGDQTVVWHFDPLIPIPDADPTVPPICTEDVLDNVDIYVEISTDSPDWADFGPLMRDCVDGLPSVEIGCSTYYMGIHGGPHSGCRWWFAPGCHTAGLTANFVMEVHTAPLSTEDEACCLGDGTCQFVPPLDCITIHGGTPMGLGTTCTGGGQCLGACCHVDGLCSDGSKDDCSDPASGLQPGAFVGFGTTCAEEPPCPQPCPVADCPAGFPGEEFESTCTVLDHLNDGCNMDPDPPVFETINCGDTVCGTYWSTVDERDTDWYEIVTTVDTAFTITLEGELPTVFGMIEYASGSEGSGDCADTTGFISPAMTTPGAPCEIGTITTQCYPAGTYWIIVRPAGFQDYPCSDYKLTVTCEENCEPAGCPFDSMFAQELTGGTAHTSDERPQLRCYENFVDVYGDLCDLHWWGINYYNDGEEWIDCEKTNPEVFEIKFYSDDAGAPGAQVCTTYTVTPTKTDTGDTFIDSIIWRYDLDLSPCCTFLESPGWVSIMAEDALEDCWFLWLNASGAGDDLFYQEDTSVPSMSAEIDDLSLCLTGTATDPLGACCNPTAWPPESRCVEDVAASLCGVPNEHHPFTLCAELDPLCGGGACCTDVNCDKRLTQGDCPEGYQEYYADTPCDPNPCSGACCLDLPCLGDCNGDGAVDGLDVDRFVDDVLGFIYNARCDMDGDGFLDPDDTNGLVDALLAGPGCFNPQPSCLDLTAGQCASIGGQWNQFETCPGPCQNACCTDAGCVMVDNEPECNSLGGTYQEGGDCSDPCAACPLTCPAGGIAEAEGCGADLNGGCGGDPPTEQFQAISCGNTICGTAWADASTRDTDWYQVTIIDPMTLTWCAEESEVPIALFIIIPGDPDQCVDVTIVDPTTGYADCGDPGVCAEATLDPGTYFLWVGTGNPDGSGIFEGYPCDGKDEYVVTLTCTP